MKNRMASIDNRITEREVRHANISGYMAARGMVLLENDGTLPLKDVRKIALFGNGARRTIKGGTGSGDVNVRSFVTVEEGLKNAGFEIVTEQWLSEHEASMVQAKREYDAHIRELSEQGIGVALLTMMGQPFCEPEYKALTDADCIAADAAIYVLSRNSGEGADRKLEKGDYYLSDTEISDIHLLAKRYEKTVLLLNVGGVVELETIRMLDGIGAILLMGQGGSNCGTAVAEVLTGRVNPSGKLTTTWAKEYGDYPNAYEFAYLDGNLKDSYYKEGIYVGYRYFDKEEKAPAYPFGYGLSYTQFAMRTTSFVLKEDLVELEIEVTNTGVNHAGQEVVQVYVFLPQGKMDKPVQMLVGFAKTKELTVGESQLISMAVALKDCASFDEEEDAWCLEKGSYLVAVGNDSRNTKIAGTFEIKEERYFTEDSYSKDEVKHTQSYTRLLQNLTPEELILLCVGGARVSMSDFSVIGNASKSIPGAAGETTGFLEYLGLPQCTMADGPAGIRVNPKVYESENGYINNISEDPILGLVLPKELQKVDLTGTTLKYQYCTALPIATMLAQTWDMDLMEQAGDLIGAELEELGIDLWLAPGMNIQKNPLCGRNFEYFSEDPFLTGWCGTAITRGVQKHKGKGVTIKHYVANNQETNRNRNNSVVSERALREIYLKGFEICVKEAKPFAIMTGVNLLNGVHVANHHHILTEILRDEWGFEGIVMTDWGATGEFVEGDDENPYGCSDTVACIKAGNDLIMPGTQGDVDRLTKAVEEGRLSLHELRVCAERMLRLLEQISV